MLKAVAFFGSGSGGGGTPGGTPTQVQYNLGGAFAGIAGSLVGAGLSVGSVSFARISAGSSAVISGLSDTYLFCDGGMIVREHGVTAGQSLNLGSGSTAGIYSIGNLSGQGTGGFLRFDTTNTTLTGGNGDVNILTNNGAQILMSGTDGSVEVVNQVSGNFVIVDSSGGASLRSSGGGGVYADPSSNTFIGNYDATAASVWDASGNVTIAAGNALPNGSTILQVGPDPATGGLFTFSGQNYGGQVFFDIGSFINSVSASIRVFTDVQCGEFAAIGNASEYFTNSQAGDCALKGDPGGGNRFLIGVGSSASQLTVEDTDVLVGLANSVGYGFLQVGGDLYASGTAGIGTTGTSAAVLKLASGSASRAPININSGLLRTSPAGGDIEYDGTHYYGTSGSVRNQLDSRSICLFTNNTAQTITNTTTETTIIPAGVGSTTLAASYLIAGRKIRIEGGGVYSSAAVPGNLTIKVKYGTTVLATATIATLLGSAAALSFDFEADVVCATIGTSGTVYVDGHLNYAINATTNARNYADLNNGGATVTINTTTANTLDITATWATPSASNIIKTINASYEALN